MRFRDFCDQTFWQIPDCSNFKSKSGKAPHWDQPHSCWPESLSGVWAYLANSNLSFMRRCSKIHIGSQEPGARNLKDLWVFWRCSNTLINNKKQNKWNRPLATSNNQIMANNAVAFCQLSKAYFKEKVTKGILLVQQPRGSNAYGRRLECVVER